MMKEAVQNASAPAMKIVAHIYNDFPAKFGIPRQSGLVNTLPSKLVMEPDYRNVDAFRGIEGFSHLWLLWMFSESIRDNWTPTVHPPRLGGNQRMGVFATRSPFRPNPIGLSSVRLDRVDLHTKEGPVLFVSGADLMSGTPIYDIKPYLPYADSQRFCCPTGVLSVTGYFSRAMAANDSGSFARRADSPVGAGSKACLSI